jgi:hypothetical protein
MQGSVVTLKAVQNTSSWILRITILLALAQLNIAQLSQITVLCTAQCNLLYSAFSCSDDACFCPTLVSVASACVGCWAAANATFASALANALSSCVEEYPNDAMTATETVFRTITASVGTVAYVTSDTPATPPSSSSNLPSGAIAGIVVGGIVVVAVVFLLLKRGRRDVREPPIVLASLDEPKTERPELPSGGLRYLDSNVD